jgi:hypothetical protein
MKTTNLAWLPVWVWRDNPNGPFGDWNPEVCREEFAVVSHEQ